MKKLLPRQILALNKLDTMKDNFILAQANQKIAILTDLQNQENNGLLNFANARERIEKNPKLVDKDGNFKMNELT